jgi:hypothetical protein
MTTPTQYIMKNTPVPCISIKQLSSGKQLVVLEKAAEPPTSTPPGGPVTINPPDISVSLVADPSENYSVGKSYKVTIQ